MLSGAADAEASWIIARMTSMTHLGWGNVTHASSAQSFSWREEHDVQKQRGGMSSGAAAMLLIRRRAADAADVPTLSATDAAPVVCTPRIKVGSATARWHKLPWLSRCATLVSRAIPAT